MDYMEEARLEALKGAEIDEVPIGCVIVYQDKIIARSHNLKELKQDVTCHAEIEAIRQANNYFHNWHLDDCILYVTLEPCMMCSGAIIQSRISKVVIGTLDNRWPGLTTYIKTHPYNHYPEIEILNDINSQIILKDYFKKKRNNQKSKV